MELNLRNLLAMDSNFIENYWNMDTLPETNSFRH